MPHPVPEWQHLAVYAIGAALLLMLLQRIPVVGKVIRFAFSLGLLAFLIFIVLHALATKSAEKMLSGIQFLCEHLQASAE